MAVRMRHISPVTSKGQVTIPKEFRDRLGVSLPDRVEFVLTDLGEVILRPVRLTVDDLFGIVPAIPGREDDDIDDIIREAMDEQAEEIVAEMTRR
jgi:antitoxin PrlF